MSKVVVSEFMESAALDPLRSAGINVIEDAALVDRPDDLQREMADADGIIVRNRTQVRGDLLKAARKLRVVGRLGVGLDNIDLEACKERGIKVIPATGANANSVAEYVLLAALTLKRKVIPATTEIVRGEWNRTAYMTHEIAPLTLGLLGFGGIARLVAEKMRVLVDTIVAYDPFVQADDPSWQALGVRQANSLSSLLNEADILSVHLPLTADTKNILDAEAIAQMKPGAVLIQTSRGSIVDESALITALRSEHLGGAALDVFATEPPNNHANFEGIPNLMLTPHISGVTVEANRRISFQIAGALQEFLVT